jgi:hypothetical protein
MYLVVGLICYAVLVSLLAVVSRFQIRRLVAQRRRYYDAAPKPGIPKHLVSYDQIGRFVRENETDKHRQIHAAEIERDRQVNLARQHRDDYLLSEQRADNFARQLNALRLGNEITVRDSALDARRKKHAEEQLTCKSTRENRRHAWEIAREAMQRNQPEPIVSVRPRKESKDFEVHRANQEHPFQS